MTGRFMSRANPPCAAMRLITILLRGCAHGWGMNCLTTESGMKLSSATSPSGLCGKFGNRLFTATVVRARRKNAGIAGPTSNPCFGQQVNAAMATVASSRVTELSKRPTSQEYPSGELDSIMGADQSVSSRVVRSAPGWS